jgi:hypothetical protein
MGGDDLNSEVERLRAQVAAMRTEAARLETEVTEMERELIEFDTRYGQLVGPVAALLDAVQSAIEELEHERYVANFADSKPLESWTQPGEYESIEEQYRRAWSKTPTEQASASPKPLASESIGDPEARLKRLFRALARRYHPDFATDDADRTYRTRLMAMINEAYAAHDVETLQTLMDQDERASVDVPLTVLHLRDLKESLVVLERRIASLEAERAALLRSQTMSLKVEARFAASQGRDLLREMAAQLEQDYWAQVARLDNLRRQNGAN